MYTQIGLALFGLASTAAATYSPHQLSNLRSVHADIEAPVRARQDTNTNSSNPNGALDPACTTSALAILGSIPEPTGDLSAFLATYDATANPSNPANLCSVTAALPSSLRAPYSSYDQQASSWYSSNSAGVQALLTSCSNADLGAYITSAVGALESYTAAGCSGPLSTPTLSLAVPTGANATFTTSAPTATATDGAGAGENGASSTVSQDAAARPTGVFAGAVAAAGLLGAAMML